MTEAATGRQDSKKSLDVVQLRELLGELVERKESSALLEVVFGVLLKAEKVIEGQAFEIQQLRKQLFGRRSEKLSRQRVSRSTSGVPALSKSMRCASPRTDHSVSVRSAKRPKRARRSATPSAIRSGIGKSVATRWSGARPLNSSGTVKSASPESRSRVRLL